MIGFEVVETDFIETVSASNFIENCSLVLIILTNSYATGVNSISKKSFSISMTGMFLLDLFRCCHLFEGFSC